MLISVPLDTPGVTVRVPKCIHVCFQYIIENATDAHGIFRVSGLLKNVTALTRQFTRFPNTEIKNLGTFTIHDIATVVKRLVLQNLSNSNTSVVSEGFTHLLEIQQSCTSELELVQKTFPLIHIQSLDLHLLLYLTSCLKKISTFSTVTEMPVSNLAIVFQPLLFSSDGMVSTGELKRCRDIVEAYIKHAVELQQLYLAKQHEPIQTVKVKVKTFFATAAGEKLAVGVSMKKSIFLKGAFSLHLKRLIS